MAELTLTQEQKNAITRRGKVIVSASAGSGKTFVMIRRLIDAIVNGLEMQDILAVTYTTKAAESMAEKLRDALVLAVNEAKSEEEKQALKRKFSEISLADISTIHAFCSRLIKRYFYEIEVGDSFSIASTDDADGKLLYDEAMADMIAKAYEEGDKDFSLLLQVFRSRSGAKGVSDAVTKVYEEIRSDCDYRELLASGGNFTEDSFHELCSSLLKEWQATARVHRDALEEIAKSLSLAPADCMEVYDAVNELLRLVENATDVFSLVNEPLPDKPSKGRTKKGISEEGFAIRDEINLLKDSAFKFFSEQISSCGLADRETELNKYLFSGEIARALYKYILKFDEQYSALKKKRLKLDYNDLEHYALALLEKEEVRKAVRAKYKMVFVDEYQDVNPTQEKIISAVAGEELFLVGDKKQAIYAFRGGKSRYFSQKEEEFGEGRLFLSSNFRSSRKILQFVNEVFSYAMDTKNSDIDYKEKPMQGGDRYGEYDGLVKIHVCEEEKKQTPPLRPYRIEEFEELLPDYKTAEGEKILSIIRASVSSPTADNLSSDAEKEAYYEYYDIDEKKKKRVGYGDIAVLVRSVGNEGVKNVVNYLIEQGVPVSSLSPVNVCDFSDVKQLIGILQVLDNPESDVPLCVALLSPVGDLTEDDLSRVRIFGNGQGEDGSQKSFRVLCGEYASSVRDETAEKLNAFYRNIAQLKKKSYLYSAAEVLGEILTRYGVEIKLLSQPNGKNRMARVERFLAECGTDSVHDFLRKLKTTGYRVEYTENNGDDSIKILTIHKSKGLEYPVVILPFLNAPFHNETKEDIVVDGEYGFVPKFYDLERMKKQKTVFSLALERKRKREQIKDELNVFYVALTRAKYAMHLVLSKEKKEFGFTRFSDFLPDGIVDKYRADIPVSGERLAVRDILHPVGCARELKELSSVYQKPYPFAGSEEVAVKSSATSLMKELQQEEYYAVHHPFAEGAGKTSSAVGTAYHAFLEHANFASPQGEYERLFGVLEKEDYALLDKDKCERILSLPIFSRLQGDTLYRERKFIVTFPANAFDLSVNSEDPVLYQGAIDLLAVGKEGVTLVDYKYSQKSADELKRHYLPQIRLYRDAVAKLMKIEKSTIRTVILNIYREEEIFVEL